MISYGIVIIIIIACLAVIYILSTPTRQSFTTSQCIATSGFSCGYSFLYFNGIMYLSLTQATGGDVTVYGIACASSINSSTAALQPGYGNYFTTNNPTFYPQYPSQGAGTPGMGVRISSGSSYLFELYCYNAGGVATYTSGQNTYAGYFWINYSLPGTSTKITQLIGTVETQYI